MALLPSFWLGGKLVTMYRWDATEALKIIDKDLCFMKGTPTLEAHKGDREKTLLKVKKKGVFKGVLMYFRDLSGCFQGVFPQPLRAHPLWTLPKTQTSHQLGDMLSPNSCPATTDPPPRESIWRHLSVDFKSISRELPVATQKSTQNRLPGRIREKQRGGELRGGEHTIKPLPKNGFGPPPPLMIRFPPPLFKQCHAP